MKTPLHYFLIPLAAMCLLAQPLFSREPALSAPPEGHMLAGDSLIFLFDPAVYRFSGTIRSVGVQGYFNGWDPKRPGWQLTDPDGDGLWQLTVPDGGTYLGYRFRFVVNGKVLVPPAETDRRFVYRSSDGEEELLIGGHQPNRWLEKSQAGTVPLPDGTEMPYRLILPEGYDPLRRYPLVLFFHGMGERGSDNTLTLAPCNGAWEFLETASREHEFIMLVPQCPGDSWWTYFNRKPSPPLTGALKLLDDTIRDYPVDEARVYVTGLSMGGFASWESAFRRPRVFAAGLILCAGYFNSIVPAIKEIPFSVWHGAKDPTSPAAASRAIVKALRKAGGTVLYTELDDGHDIWIEVYSDPEAVGWLFLQNRYP